MKACTRHFSEHITSNITSGFAYALRLEGINDKALTNELRTTISLKVQASIEPIHARVSQVVEQLPDEQVIANTIKALSVEIASPVIQATSAILQRHPAGENVDAQDCVWFGLQWIDDNPLATEVDRLASALV